MDPMEVEVEKGGLRRSIESDDDEENEFEICVCTQHKFNEVECYKIKVPDPEAVPPLSYFCPGPPPSFDSLVKGLKKEGEPIFNPKKIDPIYPSIKGPFACRYFAVIGTVLYAVGGKLDIEDCCLDDVAENYNLEGDPVAFMNYIPSREVWTLELTCPEQDESYGWMEVYDPILGSWECLPNPPSYSKTDAIVFAGLECKNEIMVGNMERSGDADYYGYNIVSDYYSYNIVSSSWRKTPEMGEWSLVNSSIEQGRAAVVGNSNYYWASILHRDSRECTIFGFNSDSKQRSREIINTSTFLGPTERFVTTGCGFLHLSGQKFCLLLRSINKFSNYLYCLVLHLSAFLPRYPSDCEVDDDDDGILGNDGSRLTVLSIQKYSMVNFTDLLDCLIFNVKSQTQNKRKLKTSVEGKTSAEGSETIKDY
uniref:Uncharacterized protein n=1 Tax=Quercus lobata TaxID=97700 RepID=A0A7N2N0Y7_QUELO